MQGLVGLLFLQPALLCRPHLGQLAVPVTPSLDGQQGQQGDGDPQRRGAAEKGQPAVPEGVAAPEGTLGLGQRVAGCGLEGALEVFTGRDAA